MTLVFLGPPGAGKGTQAERVCKKLHIPHVSTGDILRRAVAQQTKVGLEAKKYMDSGDLVPDDVVVQIVAERLKESDCLDGFLLDGFPRTLTQGKALDEALKEAGQSLDIVVYFDTSEEVVIERLTGRRTCKSCGAIYHLTSLPPQQEGICDSCGGELYQRPDDTPLTVRERLVVYQERTAELVDYYEQRGLISKVSGDRDMDQVNEMVTEVLDVA